MIRKKLAAMSLVLLFAMPLAASAEPAAQPAAQPQSNSISWPQNQELPSFAKVKKLEVADVYDAPGDIKLMLSTLQGIVNRKEPRVYLLESQEEGKLTWLNDLKIPYALHDDYWDLVSTFKKEVKGIIVYDPNLPDSINVATTLAGLKDAVVASPELAQKLTAAPYSLPVLDDLQGRFKDRLDAYSWEYDNLWSQTTHRMLIGLSPDTSIRLPSDNFASFQTIAQETTQERDAKNRKVYDLDLSQFLGKDSVFLRFQDAFTQDGWGPAVHEVTVKADGREIAHFLPGTPDEQPFLFDSGNSQISTGSGGHRFADNGRYFVYKFTPPAGTKQLTVSVDMWNQFLVSASNVQPLSSDAKEPYGYLRDYAVANKAMVFWLGTSDPGEQALFEKILSDVEPGTPYLGWFSDDVSGEFSGVELTSRHGVYVLASDWFSNMTVFSGTKAKQADPKPVKAPQLENKIYVTYTFGEGDNLQYNEHHMRNLWEDPNRGKVPINWTSSPLLYDAAPAILNHYLDTATANDQLVAGPSGAGYFYPNVWPENSFANFLKSTYSYLKKTGMTIPFVLNRISSQDVPLSDSAAAAYRDQYRVPGVLLAYNNSNEVEIQDGLPVTTMRGISTVADGQKLLSDIKSKWDGKSPQFVSISVSAWNMTPTDVLALNDSLDSDYQAVLADPFFALIREANGLPKH
ncbi:GxGYxYP domain-containing protein [Cohnella zeiphila]